MNRRAFVTGLGAVLVAPLAADPKEGRTLRYQAMRRGRCWQVAVDEVNAVG
jgi:hypothetical protein